MVIKVCEGSVLRAEGGIRASERKHEAVGIQTESAVMLSEL